MSIPPDGTSISTEQLLQIIGELTIENRVLRQRLTIIQSELAHEREEHIKEMPYSEPHRIPQKQIDSERM